MQKNTLGFYFLCSVLIPMLMLPFASAQSGYGTPKISLNTSMIDIYQGGSGKVFYNVAIQSGNSSGTAINIVNAKKLGAMGITGSLGSTIGNPPFNGILTLTVSNTTPAYEYNVTLNTTGGDPSTNNTYLVFTVLKVGGNGFNTTTTQSQIASTTVQPSGGFIPSQPTSNYDAAVVYVTIVVVALIIAVAAYLLIKKKLGR